MSVYPFFVYLIGVAALSLVVGLVLALRRNLRPPQTDKDSLPAHRTGAG